MEHFSKDLLRMYHEIEGKLFEDVFQKRNWYDEDIQQFLDKMEAIRKKESRKIKLKDRIFFEKKKKGLL